MHQAGCTVGTEHIKDRNVQMSRKGPGAKSGMRVQCETPGEVPAYRSWEGRDTRGMCRGHTVSYVPDEQQDQDSGVALLFIPFHRCRAALWELHQLEMGQ